MINNAKTNESMKKISDINQGDLLAFEANNGNYKVLLCTSTYKQKVPQSFTFATLTYEDIEKPTAEKILNSDFWDIGNTKNEYFKYSEIEGELLNYEQVCSSIARRLGISTAGLVPSSRQIEGIVEMMLDATQRFKSPLTEKRLFGWHAALFPTGYSGPYEIEVSRYRTGEMQVVSGAPDSYREGKAKVHYEAVKPALVKAEMNKFLNWFNNDNNLDPVLKAAIAHFWFIIIHPFDDGNGRIARAINLPIVHGNYNLAVFTNVCSVHTACFDAIGKLSSKLD